jgi:uncharacterized protein (TIGR03067 family)
MILLTTLLAAAAASSPCPPIEGLEPLLKPGKVLLLGELHGTEESPAFTLDVACHAAEAGLEVIVGLELAGEEQMRVDGYLNSKGTGDDRDAMLSGHIWRRDYQDGRNSAAMVELIDGLRRLRVKHDEIRVTLFDATSEGGGQARDRKMGTNLLAVAHAERQAMIIALAGNMHTRTSLGNPRNPEFEPMGYVLSKGAPGRVTSLNAAHGKGTAWICGPKCGTVQVGGQHGESRWKIEIDEQTRPAGHDGRYHVGGLTASMPAARPDLVRAQQPSKAPARPRAAATVIEAIDAEVPLSEVERKLQGEWQARDFSSNSRLWKMSFDRRAFHAQGGTDDWYKGQIVLDPDAQPAQINFLIEDCRCPYKGQASTGIYYWDGEAIVIAAPQPGIKRPDRFVERSGQMIRLKRVD